MELYLGQRKINPWAEGTAIVVQCSGSTLSFSGLTKCRRTGTAPRPSRENDWELSRKASARLSLAPGEPSHEFPIVTQAEGGHTCRGVCQEDTGASPGASPAAWWHKHSALTASRAGPHLLLSGDAAAEELPSHSSKKLLLCFGGIIFSFHLHLSYSSVFWYTVSVWKWTKKQKCSQYFQSLIFILCQNRIPDWSNIVFWLMCFRKLVADPDWEWSLFVDDSAGENIAEIVFLLIIWNMPR